MYVYNTYIYTHTYIYICIFIYIYTCTHPHVHIHMYLHINTYMHIHIRSFVTVLRPTGVWSEICEKRATNCWIPTSQVLEARLYFLKFISTIGARLKSFEFLVSKSNFGLHWDFKIMSHHRWRRSDFI